MRRSLRNRTLGYGPESQLLLRYINDITDCAQLIHSVATLVRLTVGSGFIECEYQIITIKTFNAMRKLVPTHNLSSIKPLRNVTTYSIYCVVQVLCAETECLGTNSENQHKQENNYDQAHQSTIIKLGQR
jgi:hypothetical protein